MVAGDECRKWHFREVLVDSLCLADVRDANGRRRKMAEEVQGTNGSLDFADRKDGLLLRSVATHDEVRAVGGTTQHTEVCPFGQAEREDFFHGEVARELAEEILELAVRERLPTCGEG